MTLTGSAEENLKVIRSLMERATVYRTISVPGALWAGLLSLAGYGSHRVMEAHGIFLGRREFLALWLTVMSVTLLGNAVLLKREAIRSERVFLSPGLRTALRGLLPCFLVAMAVTLFDWEDGDSLVLVWMVLYGLGLLGTQHFAPRSLVVLAWAFIGAAFVFGLGGILFFGRSVDPLNSSLCMALTFGLFHLIYALCVHLSLRKERVR